MDILLADVLGLCFGVRRAITLAEDALRAGQAVYTLGPLVHNPQEVARLSDAGIRALETLEALSGDTVVIRAHGARPEVFEHLQQEGITIVDATCPFVAKSQRLARNLTDQGYNLVIVGHPGHPEVQGILGYAQNPAYVITDPIEVAALPRDTIPAVIAQTTVNEHTFLDMVEAIVARFPHPQVYNTVCSATRERQDAARRLASQVDAVYVVGGRESSNTNRLAEICRALCPATRLIETAAEIAADDMQGVERVGITAGASTPDWLIEQVVATLRTLAGEVPLVNKNER
jgi:4-hydroxy-3-methylbut-2-enyl diphosphate reductase